MKKLMIVLMALSSFSAFAESVTYEGYGKTTSYGIEVCGMTITPIGSDKLELELYALGSSAKTIVVKSNEIKFNVKTKSQELPESDIEMSGKIVNGRPVSFKYKSTSLDFDFKESMKCNF